MGPASRRLRVVVTRPAEHAGELAQRIEALGHAAVLCPLIEIEPVGPEAVDTFGYDWLDADHLAVYILDVTGHGLDSALFAVTVMNALYSCRLT